MINKIGLSNFKCFERQEIATRRLTLLTGLNGMGKSTAIQALLLLRQSRHQGLLEKTGLALNGDLVSIGRGTDALYEDAKEDFIEIRVVFDSTEETIWRFAYDREADVIGLVFTNATTDTFMNCVFGDAFCYLNAERCSPKTAYDMSDYLVRNHRQLGLHGQYAAHYLSAWGREEVKSEGLRHAKAESHKLRDQVEAWLSEISPGTRVKVDTHGTMDLITLEYAFVRGQEVSSYYRATNVGFGITYTLPILVALLGASSGGTVIVENPEAHLHPRGQAKMGELIARAAASGVQVIIETHSDHVLNGIRLAVLHNLIPPADVAIHFFARSEAPGAQAAKVTSTFIDRDGRIADWPDGFFDEWDRALESLLAPRKE